MTRKRGKSTSTLEYFNPLLSETARTGRQKNKQRYRMSKQYTKHARASR